jgi:peptide/nickel transport system substrate-binding protein
VWHPRQPSPATAWEREIDDLMHRQASSLDLAERQRLFAEVQRLVGEHAPAMSFAVPHVYIAASPRVGHFTPAVQRPQVLWDAGRLAELKMEN